MGREVNVSGSKADGIGSVPLPAPGDTGPDNYAANYDEILNRLAMSTGGGYYHVDGDNYFCLPDVYTDRLTGALTKIGRWVRMDSDLSPDLGNQDSHYRDSVFQGNLNLPNPAPLTVDDSFSTIQDTDVVLDLLGNDEDPHEEPLFLGGVDQPDYGTVWPNPDGTVTFRPVGQSSK